MLATFKSSIVFLEAAGAGAKIGFSLKANQHTQI